MLAVGCKIVLNYKGDYRCLVKESSHIRTADTQYHRIKFQPICTQEVAQIYPLDHTPRSNPSVKSLGQIPLPTPGFTQTVSQVDFIKKTHTIEAATLNMQDSQAN